MTGRPLRPGDHVAILDGRARGGRPYAGFGTVVGHVRLGPCALVEVRWRDGLVVPYYRGQIEPLGRKEAGRVA